MEALRLAPIPLFAIGQWWVRVEPWAEEFCKRSQGSYDPPYIRGKLEEGLMQLWLMMAGDEILGVCITEIRQTLIKECVIVITMGTDMQRWLPLLAHLEHYAGVMGCKKIVGVARLGWQKVLKPQGYVPTHIQMEKFL